jgi:hypothetical protein
MLLMESTGLFLSLDELQQVEEPTLVLLGFGGPVTITVSAIAMLQMAVFDLLKSVRITPDAIRCCLHGWGQGWGQGAHL